MLARMRRCDHPSHPSRSARFARGCHRRDAFNFATFRIKRSFLRRNPADDASAPLGMGMHFSFNLRTTLCDTRPQEQLDPTRASFERSRGVNGVTVILPKSAGFGVVNRRDRPDARTLLH
jgi:hypothetical protein